MSNRITCSVCKNEKEGFCEIKQIGVHVNKRRNCNKFILEESKVKPKHLVKTVYIPYEDKKLLKKLYKQELDKPNTQSNTEHPLTGDLSRFKSTAVKDS